LKSIPTADMIPTEQPNHIEVTPTGVSYECYIYCNYNMNEFRVHFDQLNKI